MARRNPGPFEPILYLIQTPAFFRVVGLGGLVVFTLVFLGKAAAHGAGACIFGIAIGAALWVESTLTACRRCRHFGTWHCAGQGMIAARLFGRVAPGVGQPRVWLHFGLIAIYLAYGLFWMWHGIATGMLFTVWAGLFVMSLNPADGFSWRFAARSMQAA